MRRIDGVLVAGCVIVAVVLGGCAARDRYEGMAGPREYDRTFMVTAFEAAMAEAVIGETGVARGADATVRRAARAVMDGDRAMLDELYNLAQDKGVPMPNAPGYFGQAAVAELDAAAVAGTVDSEFVRVMTRSHRRLIEMYADASERAGDPDVRRFAARHLPNLRDRLREIEALPAAAAGAAAAPAAN